MKYIKDLPRILAKDDVRVPINITPEAREELRLFLTQDLAVTGIGYSEFIRQSIRMWREMNDLDLPTATRELESLVDGWRYGNGDVDEYRDDDRETFPALTRLRDALSE